MHARYFNFSNARFNWTVVLGLLILATDWSSDALADCATQPATSVIERQVTTRPAIRDSSICIDGCGRYVVGWHDLYSEPGTNQRHVRFLRYNADCTTQPYSGQNDGTPLSTQSSSSPCNGIDTINTAISVAMGAGSASVSPPLFATWTGIRTPSATYPGSYHLKTGTWTFDQSSPPTPIGTPDCDGPLDTEFNSTGIANGVNSTVKTSAWTRTSKTGVTYKGLLAETPIFTEVRDCSPTYCYEFLRTPCISTRSTGESAMVFCESEDTGDSDPRMNIFIIEYNSAGTEVPTGSTGVQVNAPDPPFSFRTQESPSVAMVNDRIVVTWVGPDPDAAPECGALRIFAKILSWNGSGVPTTQKADFIVDTDWQSQIGVSVAPNPTVAITLSDDSEEAGRFIIAWNTKRTRFVAGAPRDRNEIHAQYFTSAGERIGGEFRLNVADTGGNSGFRQLARSGQHTIVYGAQGQVIATWSQGQTNNEEGVFYTYLPPGFETTLPAPCRPGDFNGDGEVNGGDIQLFVDYYLNGLPTGVSEAEFNRLPCAADMDRNGSDTIDCFDRAVFLWLLLGYQPGDATPVDCDSNCRPDYIDAAILYYDPWHSCCCTTQPGTDPPANWPCCNETPSSFGDCVCCSIQPDIRPDCTPYGGDCPVTIIASFADCNENGIDDLIDIADETSADCNLNTEPDECELEYHDCNANGVPDDCDIDPTDPDGDSVVYPDCNNSSLPDECDLELPLNPSYDCNENGIPDECDIASAHSEDADENGIPDECEEELMMGMMAGGQEGGAEIDEDAAQQTAWLAFYEWQMGERAALSAMSHVERFEATRDKLRELGLPEAIPWATVRAP